ncbi:hypothetical protein FBQ82_04805 [Anaerolineae bacterium CFX7]|nr:hypothetical protein [Anaerolineae bacterium CFX7]
MTKDVLNQWYLDERERDAYNAAAAESAESARSYSRAEQLFDAILSDAQYHDQDDGFKANLYALAARLLPFVRER